MIPYLEKARKAHPQKTDLEIEFLLANTVNVQRYTGLEQWEHRLNAMKLLWPDRQHFEWYRKKVQAVHEARRTGVKEVGFSGCANSMKTSSLADIPLTLWFENPDVTTVYIASPYRNATETNLWARVVEQFEAAKELHPYLPGRVIASQAKIVQYERNPLSFIQVTTVDDIAKLVGKKAKRFDEGLLLIEIDESPELPGEGAEMLKVLTNLHSVPNFLLLYAGNFASTDDFMGKMAEPRGGYDWIKGKEDELFEYRTKRGGMLYRFDGHQSENFKAGKDFTDIVCTMSYAQGEAERSGGTNSPGYMRFIRSWPVLDISEYRVTNSGKIDAGKAESPAHFTADTLQYFSFCDPGFGGDPAVIQDARVGQELRDGRKIPVFELDGPPITIPIDLKKGVSPEAQIVAFHKQHCAEKQIPAANVGFDGSMRAGIVHQYAADWGIEVTPVDPQGPATERVFDSKSKKAWKDEVFNFVAETWFAVGLLIQSGQLRGLGHSPEARSQLCRRSWKWRGDRKQLQPKDEYKKHNQQKSPNEADALCGAVEMARRRGFNVLVLSGQGLGAVKLLQQIIAEREQKALVKQILGGNKLPPGHLHGIQADSFHGRSRLHT